MGNGYDEIGYNSPDYSNAQVIFNPEHLTNQTLTYAVLNDGWVAGEITLTRTGVTYLKINNIIVGSAYGYTGVIAGRDGIFAKVSKGDTVELSTNGVYDYDCLVYFVSHK